VTGLFTSYTATGEQVFAIQYREIRRYKDWRGRIESIKAETLHGTSGPGLYGDKDDSDSDKDIDDENEPSASTSTVPSGALDTSTENPDRDVPYAASSTKVETLDDDHLELGLGLEVGRIGNMLVVEL
jgi:hypothetical protein